MIRMRYRSITADKMRREAVRRLFLYNGTEVMFGPEMARRNRMLARKREAARKRRWAK